LIDINAYIVIWKKIGQFLNSDPVLTIIATKNQAENK